MLNSRLHADTLNRNDGNVARLCQASIYMSFLITIGGCLPVERGVVKDGLVFHPVAYPDFDDSMDFAARLRRYDERQDPGYLVARYTPRSDEDDPIPVLFQKAVMLLAAKVQEADKQHRPLSNKPFSHVELFLTPPKGKGGALRARGIFEVDALKSMQSAPTLDALRTNEWIVLDQTFRDWDVGFIRKHAMAQGVNP